MDIKYLETFITVNELHSFTQTANALGYTQSTISFQIHQLEQELGHPLFERFGHNVALTGEGTKFLPIAQEILRLSAEAKNLSSPKAPKGLVRIGTAESLSSWQFRTRFREFHELYPDVHLQVFPTTPDDMIRMLSQNQVDLIYTMGRQNFGAQLMVAHKAPVKIQFVTYPTHPLVGKQKVSLKELISYPLILTEKGMSYRAGLDEVLAKHGLASDPIIEVGDTQLIRELLWQEIGISYLPDFVIEDDVRHGRLALLDIDFKSEEMWRMLVYHKSKWVSPELQCVIDYLSKV